MSFPTEILPQAAAIASGYFRTDHNKISACISTSFKINLDVQCIVAIIHGQMLYFQAITRQNISKSSFSLNYSRLIEMSSWQPLANTISFFSTS